METRSNKPNIDLDEILEELCSRVDDGNPDFSNKNHLNILVEILKENKWPISSIRFFVRNLWLQTANR